MLRHRESALTRIGLSGLLVWDSRRAMHVQRDGVRLDGAQRDGVRLLRAPGGLLGGGAVVREDLMPLLQLIVVLVVIGLVLYLVETLLPLDPTIKILHAERLK